MTFDEKQDILGAYVRALNRASRFDQMLMHAKNLALPGGIRYSDMPKGGSVPHGYEVWVARVDELERETERAMVRADNIYNMLKRAIDQLNNEDECKTLTERYLNPQTIFNPNGSIVRYVLQVWYSVASNVGVSESQVYRYHESAVNNINLELFKDDSE